MQAQETSLFSGQPPLCHAQNHHGPLPRDSDHPTARNIIHGSQLTAHSPAHNSPPTAAPPFARRRVSAPYFATTAGEQVSLVGVSSPPAEEARYQDAVYHSTSNHETVDVNLFDSVLRDDGVIVGRGVTPEFRAREARGVEVGGRPGGRDNDACLCA